MNICMHLLVNAWVFPCLTTCQYTGMNIFICKLISAPLPLYVQTCIDAVIVMDVTMSRRCNILQHSVLQCFPACCKHTHFTSQATNLVTDCKTDTSLHALSHTPSLFTRSLSPSHTPSPLFTRSFSPSHTPSPPSFKISLSTPPSPFVQNPSLYPSLPRLVSISFTGVGAAWTASIRHEWPLQRICWYILQVERPPERSDGM